MSEVGRPTELNDELLVKIKELYFEGLNWKEVAQTLEIPYDTFMGWKRRNYNNFADTLLTFQLERMFNNSINNIEVLQGSEDEKVAWNANSFVAETIGKKWFSKKTETDLTTGGEKLTPVLVRFIDGDTNNTNN